ncbi:hypothetical protein PZE06_19205 [Robertmurraya sp. DFI.2.37]|uniref:trypsin-like serine peptidase n=1 Tax=Robertmurraya sp. DFI.2.37 TaxID=3031819 RepID=UPI0012479ABF|nr:hypothetical protein [Robertmurraya sp. DFI.2.37]MDF1510266.1 hypothetical protein [Robertmurraya sp. DFI.2.37]
MFTTYKNELSDSEKPLLSSLGKVEFWFNKKDRSLGSGSIIQSPHFPIVATAAHCIYDWESQSFFERISFLPYLENFKVSYTPKLAVIPKDWTNGIVDYDTGFLVFSSMFSSTIDYQRHAIPIAFNLPRNMDYITLGFQNIFFPSKKPFISKGSAQKDIYKNSSLQGIKSKGKSGMSGGPWFTIHEGRYVQNSLTSLSMKSAKNTLWAPYWGELIEAAYRVAAGELEHDPRLLIHNY